MILASASSKLTIFAIAGMAMLQTMYLPCKLWWFSRCIFQRMFKAKGRVSHSKRTCGIWCILHWCSPSHNGQLLRSNFYTRLHLLLGSHCETTICFYPNREDVGLLWGPHSTLSHYAISLFYRLWWFPLFAFHTSKPTLLRNTTQACSTNKIYTKQKHYNFNFNAIINIIKYFPSCCRN